MKRYALLALLVTWVPLATQAAQASHISASHAWVRLLPGDLPAGGYVTLRNNGPAVSVIVSAHSPAYKTAMLHQTTLSANGMSSMAPLQRLSIPPHAKVALAPAGYHLMLQGATRPLKPGDTIDVTLDFADGSHLPVSFTARPANASD